MQVTVTQKSMSPPFCSVRAFTGDMQFCVQLILSCPPGFIGSSLSLTPSFPHWGTQTFKILGLLCCPAVPFSLTQVLFLVCWDI